MKDIPIVNSTIPAVGSRHVTNDKPIIANTGTNKPLNIKMERIFVFLAYLKVHKYI